MPVLPLVIAVVCLLGSALLIYPAAAAWFTQYEQSQRIEEYSSEITDLGAEVLTRELSAAHAYNDDIVGGGASIAANERLPLADGAQPGDYASQLSADAEGLMARVKIPAINVDLPIYHGTSEETLQKGVGHLEGTALPVGGESTHSVLTGHRGLATSELFTNLDRIVVGDTFTIEVFGEVLTYRVIRTLVVEPEDTEDLYPVAGEDLVTLVTCTPLGVNSHRILVTGERILPTPVHELDAAGQRPDIPGFPWWAVILVGILIVLGAYVWWSGLPPRRRTAPIDAPHGQSPPN